MNTWQQMQWTILFLLRDAIRLCLFVLCLSPGFVRFCFYYTWSSKRIVQKYARESCRQSLDIYPPHQHSTRGDEAAAPLLQSLPVVVFYTGGAWCIGYKMWGAMLARALTAAGILVVIPDYRNYPSVCIPEMVDDVQASLEWVQDHIADYGGDPNKIVIVGQSAGGHLACTLLLKRAMELAELEQEEDENDSNDINGPERRKASTLLKPTDFKGFISLSAPYDLNAMQSTFRRHGLDEDIVDRVFDGQGNAYTPSRLLEKCLQHDLDISQKLPPTLLLHGTNDATVPHHGSVLFYRQLQGILGNGAVEFTSYHGWSHTDAILEMPMNANHRFHKDVFDAVQEWTSSTDLKWPDQDAVITKRLCPAWMVSLGQSANPF